MIETFAVENSCACAGRQKDEETAAAITIVARLPYEFENSAMILH